jgi:DinB superfamily
VATDPVTVQSTLLGALRSAHFLLEATMADVTDDIANRPAAGTANPIGSAYAHAVFAEDRVVQEMQGQPPLFTTSWSGRTGTDRPTPLPDSAEGSMGEWYRSVKVDVAACRAYAEAVYAASEAFLAEADEAELNRPMDMSFIGMGILPLATAFAIFVVGHLNNLTGEISAVKGMNGLKGYPF